MTVVKVRGPMYAKAVQSAVSHSVRLCLHVSERGYGMEALARAGASRRYWNLIGLRDRAIQRKRVGYGAA